MVYSISEIIRKKKSWPSCDCEPAARVKWFSQSRSIDLDNYYLTELNKIEMNVVKLRETFRALALKVVKRIEKPVMHCSQMTWNNPHSSVLGNWTGLEEALGLFWFIVPKTGKNIAIYEESWDGIFAMQFL